ncbi:helix-turn-helix domain-containing protein [Clostridium estertheticum]|uniref:helix-turn-helix domain-containing protein n=1 Tax=Clostridium estertheticum TaxID=238834 RepID=UPI001C6E8458|nr:helix-turn-helix transcriptional regulator [Clostridium estertheticum]MBW9151350.1 helix-turn-helix domain-containing protein [Clostridium estertheticum]WLC84675.1 helix-turn-helix domain-containing protein [Clostridium estertheticum]
MKMRNIGEVISALRKQKGITQEELGNTTGLSRVIIAKIENNQRAVSLDEAVKLAKVFIIDVDTLYGFIEEEKYKTEKNTFVMAFKAKGMDSINLKEVRRIELLVDALFAQEEIRGE